MENQHAYNDGYRDGGQMAAAGNHLDEWNTDDGSETPAGNLINAMGRKWFDVEYGTEAEAEERYNEGFIRGWDEQVGRNLKEADKRYGVIR